VRRLVEKAGGRAWLFCAESASDHFIEFIEWQSDAAHPLIEHSDIANAFDELAAVFHSKDSDTWIETKI
jgi:hypothetical protein